MEEEKLNIVKTIYTGVSIYSTLKKCKIKLKYNFLTLEEKKYLSLYLGLLYNNEYIKQKIGKRKLNLEVRYNCLNLDEFSNIYSDEFNTIFQNINYNSLIAYIESLINIKIIEEFNTINNINMYEFINHSNKVLIKK